MSLALDSVDDVLDIGSSEPFVLSTLSKSSTEVGCSRDIVLGIVTESCEQPKFSPLSQLDISTSAGPDSAGDIGLGKDKDSGEHLKETELADCENVSVDFLSVTFNAFLCSIFSEIILNHFGVKWQKMTP